MISLSAFGLWIYGLGGPVLGTRLAWFTSSSFVYFHHVWFLFLLHGMWSGDVLLDEGSAAGQITAVMFRKL